MGAPGRSLHGAARIVYRSRAMASFPERMAVSQAWLLAAIDGNNPAGVDVSYEPDFEWLKTEIGKLESVTESEPSWPDVRRSASDLIARKSKDLRVLSWLCLAKLKSEGWQGLAEALFVHDGVVKAFWETMYPDVKRVRARVSVIGWLLDQAIGHVQSMEVQPADGDAVRACSEMLGELDRSLREKAGDAYAGPGRLASLLREKVASISEEGVVARAEREPAADSVIRTEAPVAPEPASSSLAPLPAPTAEDPEQVVRASARAIVEAATAMRTSNPTMPWAYRLQRCAMWIAVQEPPPSEKGRTRMRAPAQRERRRLGSLREREQWGELLTFAEETSTQYLFWLDLHRHATLAMDRLGPEFTSAREAVGQETIRFVARVPTVADLAFSDGSPFAEPETKAWLETEARRWAGAPGPPDRAAVGSGGDEEISSRVAEARELILAGRVAEGVGAAHDVAVREPSGRARLRIRLAVARMALDGAKPDLARPLLEGLVHDIEHHDLEAWEPELCALVYASLLGAIRASGRGTGGPMDAGGREQSVFDRLYRLDPRIALNLSGPYP
jgi:type VI secretion system protein VasJ